jgi:hypothetical protein
VPSGYAIHHIDHDRENNRLANLALIPAAKHNSHHAKSLWGSEEKRPQLLRRLQKMQDMAKAWHGSEAGREWHSEHAKIVMEARKKLIVMLKCEHCGKLFRTLAMAKYVKFHSNSCKSAARRKSGVDDVVRVCAVCGKAFLTNKYRKQKTCSLECGSIARRKTKASCVLK